MRLQSWASWFYTVGSYTDELAGKHPLDLASRAFYRDFHRDGFRPKQAAEEAIFLAAKEEK
jgi:hypothetical protein